MPLGRRVEVDPGRMAPCRPGVRAVSEPQAPRHGLDPGDQIRVGLHGEGGGQAGEHRLHGAERVAVIGPDVAERPDAADRRWRSPHLRDREASPRDAADVQRGTVEKDVEETGPALVVEPVIDLVQRVDERRYTLREQPGPAALVAQVKGVEPLGQGPSGLREITQDGELVLPGSDDQWPVEPEVRRDGEPLLPRPFQRDRRVVEDDAPDPGRPQLPGQVAAPSAEGVNDHLLLPPELTQVGEPGGQVLRGSEHLGPEAGA